MSKIRVLVVDDEPPLLDLTKLFLEGNGDISVDITSSAKEALRLAGDEDYDAVVSDYQMPEMDGLELLKGLRKGDRDLPFILFTGRGREDVAVAALNLGASYYLQKGGAAEAQFTELENMVRRSAEMRRSKKALKESENRFRNLVQNSSDFIVILDGQGVVAYASSSIKQILGYDDNFLLGKHALHIVHPEDHQMVLKEVGLVKDGAQDGIPTEFRVKDAHGEYVLVEAAGTNMVDVPGVEGLVITVRCIGERKKAERALAESEQAYRTLFEKSPFPITLNRLDGTFVDVNECYLQVSGLRKEEVIGKGLAEFNFTDPPEMKNELEAFMRNDGSLDGYPMVVTRASGERLNVLVSSRLITYKGEPHVLSIINDVTTLVETKKALQLKIEELDHERDRLQKITDQVPGAVYQVLLRPNGHMIFVFMSRGMEGMVHIPRDQWTGDFTKIIDLVLPEDREPLLESVRSAALSRSPWSREFRIRDVDGTVRWVLGASVIIGEEEGNILWTGTFTDVTERRRADEALRQANRQLNLMTSITRHDVLNKIVATEGYIELASRKANDPDATNLLVKARRSVDAIRSEIDLTRDLQELSVLQADWQDLDGIFDELRQVPDVRTLGGCHHLEVYANPLLKKVFHNLVDNTIRHGGHAGRISLDCRESGSELVIAYSDDGVGIPATDKERVFDRGYGKNTGMGLFLVREVLSMTNITILENGVEGEGARFELHVPAGGYRYKEQSGPNSSRACS